jgi:predicted RNase H-like HicB family nuclease
MLRRVGRQCELAVDWMKVHELIALIEADGANHGRPPGDGEERTQAGRFAVAGVDLMRYLVILEKGPTTYGAHVPDLPGCIAAGETEDEAIALIREAIESHLDDLKRRGEPVPTPSSTCRVVEIAAA